MKHATLRALAALLCLLLAVGAAACGENPGQAAAPTPDAAAAPGRDAVAVEVGDKYAVTYGEVEEAYNYLVEMMSYYGMAAPTAEADIESYQNEALAMLVETRKLLYFADELGVGALSEQEEADVQALVDADMEYYMEGFRATAEDEGAEDVDARAYELFDEELAAYEMHMDHIEYAEYLYEMYAEQQVIENLETHIRSTAAIDADDVQAYYDQLVESQTAAYAEDPSLYFDEEENFEMNGGDPSVVVPEGYLRVKAIAVFPQGTLDASYEEKTAQMADYEAEYGRLALTGADAARRSEIETLYAALKLETDAMYAAYMQDAKAKIDEAHALLEAGGDFDEVLASHGEDPTFTDYTLIAERGRLMSETAGADDWDDALRAAALALADGAYSDVMQVGDAYYILCRVGGEAAGTRPLDEVHAAVEAAALLAEQDSVWAEQEVEWDEDDSMLVYHEEVYRSIGK